MRYGRVLVDAWRALWRSWSLWGFQATFMGAYAVVFGGGMAAFFWTLGSTLDGPEPDPFAALGLMGAFALIGLAAIPLFWIFHGGSIHLTNEALEGRPVRYGDGWRVGFRRIWSLAGFHVLVWLIGAAIYGLLMGLLIAMMVGISAGATGDDGGMTALFGGLCCFYIVFFLVMMAAAVFAQAFEAVGARAAVLSGRGGLEAFRDAWRALTGRFKHMTLMGLMMLGLTYAWSIVTSIVLVPAQLLTMPQMFDPSFNPDSPEVFGAMGMSYLVVIVLSIALTYPFTVFLYLAWTAFYRQLVGITPAEEVEAPTAFTAAEPYVPAPPSVDADPGSGIVPPPPPPPGTAGYAPGPAEDASGSDFEGGQDR